ncbi:Serpin domain-containing protein [Aspergillus bertholletiae]|uniref:Serpin domain-containing protein n=1 Tax=Aspergillus bertholletiae TaxID=1226010 RepID=A0A5N7BKX5_9EURO|nr:Serpin domain-containing protein [Aspergillus bertholletiae]
MASPSRTIPPSVIQTINQLGWNLAIHQCGQRNVSAGLAFSPLSITVALAMLAGGADDATCHALCDKLGVDSLDSLIPVLSTIQGAFLSAPDRGPQLTSANAMFTDRSTEVVPTYVEYLQHCGAYLDCSLPRLADGVDVLNGWVAKQTNGLIPSMLSRQTLALAHIVLINALVFKATWQTKFDPENTIPDFPFHTPSGPTRPVDMMFLDRPEVLISEGNGYTAARLPYASSASSSWSFIAYLPSDDSSPLETLQVIRRDGAPRHFVPTKLRQLGLPKFNLHAQEEIAETLCQLGYPIAGEFPGISSYALVQHVIHNVTILLDENGTEAAAATAVVMTRSRSPRLPSLVLDRPFVFSIVAEDMDLVVFTGVFSVA